MIRDSLAVVVVVRRHSERLSTLLQDLKSEGIRAGIVVANLSGDALPTDGDVLVIDGTITEPLGRAVGRAIESTDAETIWILRDDMGVRPGALAALTSVLDTSPSVGVVGPKVLDANAPAVILEMGESMTRSGYSVALAERELDQAQYDRVSDVLAVGEAGMLVRREVWDSVGGFDRALTSVDAALDFCYRARTAGWRVEVVPSAHVDARDSSWESFRGQTPRAQLQREISRTRAHRLLTQRPAFVAMFAAVGLGFSALVRGLGRFVQKREAPFAEFAGTSAAAFDLAALARARRNARRSRTQPIEGSRLFVPSSERARRRALERDELIAALEAADDDPRLSFGVAATWWMTFFVLAGLVLAGPLLGAEALAGGAALPLPSSIVEAWSAIGATWSEAAGGSTVAPDGFVAVVAMLASLTWWNPNALVIGIVALAVPLSFVAGYIGSGVLTTNSRTALIAGGAWALLPTLHIAVGEGRLPAILVHILLPFAVRALFGSTIVSIGWTSILIAVMWASVPSLAPILVLGVVLRVVTGSPAMVLALAPALALEWPRILESLSRPLTYFADRGFPAPSTSPTGFGVLTLWPSTVTMPFVDSSVATLIALAIVATAVVLVGIAVIVADNTRVGIFALVGGVALLEVAALSGVTLASANGAAVSLFTGPLLDVVWFGLVVGVAITLTSLRRTSTVLGPITVLTIGAVGIVPLTAVAMGSAPVHATTVRTLPAYVEAQTAIDHGGGTVVLTPTNDGLVVALERDGGVTLLDWAATAVTRTTPTPTERAIGELAANLVVESDADVIALAQESHVSFVLLDATVTAPEVSTISSHAGLVQVGETDRGILWRVDSAVEPDVTDRAPNLVYRLALGAVGVVALIAAVPTALPRRRRPVDDVVPLDEEVDDEHS